MYHSWVLRRVLSFLTIVEECPFFRYRKKGKSEFDTPLEDTGFIIIFTILSIVCSTTSCEVIC